RVAPRRCRTAPSAFASAHGPASRQPGFVAARATGSLYPGKRLEELPQRAGGLVAVDPALDLHGSCCMAVRIRQSAKGEFRRCQPTQHLRGHRVRFTQAAPGNAKPVLLFFECMLYLAVLKQPVGVTMPGQDAVVMVGPMQRK